jgi:hypothetical protein
MDANDWFASQVGKPRAPEHHNDFGGFLGGPIFKDKTFFFFSFEGARLDQPQTTTITVPSTYARAHGPGPLLAYLNAYPLPDDQTPMPGVYTAQFIGTYANPAYLNATSIRIDHSYRNGLSVFGRYNYAPSHIVQRGGGSSSVSLSNLWTTSVNTQTATVGMNMALTPTIANALRGNYSEQTSALSFGLDSFGGAVPLAPATLLGSLAAVSNVGLFYTFDTSYFLQGSGGKNQARQINIADDLTLSSGLHRFKFGVDYRALFLNLTDHDHQLSYFATSVQDFLSTASVSASGLTQLPARFLTKAFSAYAQDTWKASARLTLNYGVRWDLSPAPSARGTTSVSALENVNDPARIALAPPGTRLWATTYSNFAPRLGLAYSLTPRGDFLLRGGGGIFYDLGVGSSANLAFNFPNSAYSFISAVSLPVSDISPLLPVISVQPPYPNGVQGFSSSLKLPRSYQWNIALEKSLAGSQVVTATYVGQVGRDLLRQSAEFQPNSNFAGDLLLTGNDAYSHYEALQLQYRRPLGSGLQALVNYSWSHSLDNASNDVVNSLSNSVISAARDYASSDFDVRQSLSGALNWEVPGTNSRGLATLTRGWSLQGILVARSGFPLNAHVLFASPDPGGYAESRPDRVSAQPVWIPNPQAGGGKSLNPDAFSVPSTPRQGTESRNDITGFGLTQFDLSLQRKFAIGDRLNVQFRTDAFNLLNHPNFSNPAAYVELGASSLESSQMLNQALGGLNPLFQEGGSRSLQLSLKLTF